MAIWPRFIARFAAWIGGYSWLPCPVCKENFAGFEAYLGSAGIPDGEGFKCVCSKPECVEAGMKAYADFMQKQVFILQAHPLPSPPPPDRSPSVP